MQLQATDQWLRVYCKILLKISVQETLLFFPNSTQQKVHKQKISWLLEKFIDW